MAKISVTQIALLASLTAVLMGCGNAAKKAAPLPPAPAVDPATAAQITGTVKFEGTPPHFNPIDMSAAPACVKANSKPVIPQVVVTGAHGALANVVVYIKSGIGRYRYPTPESPVILDQKGCMYAPHVLALMVGQQFEVANSDLTLHDVHPMLENNPSWNMSQLPGSTPATTKFSSTEFADPIVCMIHPWMQAYLFVFDQPYFAVTSKTGSFELKNLPPGTYTVEAWHEPNQTQDQTVVLGPKGSKSISFTFGAASSRG
ncbi:MAG TPA: carboxypeptidase regulatory-like domain-containing protein [Candidatus Dormibacteraeota bacterium]|nr:carboxypeptidase regulatory-like domain-containing protein [Candidatus Dormibacteraeota bacterium]